MGIMNERIPEDRAWGGYPLAFDDLSRQIPKRPKWRVLEIQIGLFRLDTFDRTLNTRVMYQTPTSSCRRKPKAEVKNFRNQERNLV